MTEVQPYDVVIIGAGLAGLSLSRQLLLNSGKRILLLDKRSTIPPAHQKVGEATVQLSAYYFSKVLDLEEHLFQEHYLKYNLRFYWKTAGSENRCFENYSQSYIRNVSNIATYQLNRNEIEREMLRLNLANPNFDFRAPISDLKVSLREAGPHVIHFKADGVDVAVQANWVVDTSGRGKFLARSKELHRENPIRHGASFFWVDGLVNIEKLTDLTPAELRLKKDRSATGHFPIWLATNHFCGEGFWFWVIPLQGKTSLGLVYDNQTFPVERISTLKKLIDWACEEFPLFARDLPHRKILDHGSLKDFSFDCAQTISRERWALSGEAGRFTDPLYSPGGDLIALYNTLITDAILTADNDELTRKCTLYESLMQGFYEAYVPSFAVSYDVLGDQEAMTLKYSWELAIYFSFYVFPFINGLFTNQRFIPLFLRRFSQLGPINRNLQSFVSGYYQWKKTNRPRARQPIFNDFTEVGALKSAQETFLDVGVSVETAGEILDRQLSNLREMARFVLAFVTMTVLADERVLTNRSFIESIDLANYTFDPNAMRERYAKHAHDGEPHNWSFDTSVLRRFVTEAHVKSDERSVSQIQSGGVQWTTSRL